MSSTILQKPHTHHNRDTCLLAPAKLLPLIRSLRNWIAPLGLVTSGTFLEVVFFPDQWINGLALIAGFEPAFEDRITTNQQHTVISQWLRHYGALQKPASGLGIVSSDVTKVSTWCALFLRSKLFFQSCENYDQMPTNRNALIRYKTLDACLRNRHRKWTLDDLIERVSDALYEYEGIDKGISRRTIQADLQMMRSDKLGYFAPIIVVGKKYYTYENPDYSITNIPLSEGDLHRMNEAVEVLKQFKGFSHFSSLNSVVQKLEDHVHSTAKKSNSVIYFEKNEELKGLEFLDELYQAVIYKKALKIQYQSFSARFSQDFIFHVWWLKEFKNRWFAIGVREGRPNSPILNLALDRIQSIRPADEIEYVPNQAINPDTYYRDVIGVTVSENLRASKVELFITHQHAPYVETKPLHHSQYVLKRLDDGIIIGLTVQHNFELEREILGFGEGIVVLSPKRLRMIIKKRLAASGDAYAEPNNEE